jgi:hypothetical protein
MVLALVARDANEANMTVFGKSVFGWSLESGGRFCIDEFVKNLASVAEIFSRFIYFFKKFINFVPSMRFAKIMG